MAEASVMGRSVRAAAGISLLLLGSTVPAAAQGFTGVTGAFFETYEFLEPEALGIQRVSLATVPVGAQVPVIDRVSVDLRSAFAYGSMTRADGTEVTLSGLTDTELRANFECQEIGNNWFIVQIAE